MHVQLSMTPETEIATLHNDVKQMEVDDDAS